MAFVGTIALAQRRWRSSNIEEPVCPTSNIYLVMFGLILPSHEFDVAGHLHVFFTLVTP